MEKLDHRAKYKEGEEEIIEVKTKHLRARWVRPWDATKRKGDLMVVDKAAGIPVRVLFAILECASRAIYSSTVHGYEGAGRSFSVRFLHGLSKLEGVEAKRVEMKDPIRYSSTDPIEAWIFDSLLLDAEPSPPEGVDLKKVRYIAEPIEEWLRDERRLREFFGIFVLAHYRNNPNDFALLCDAPNYEIRALGCEDHIVASVQLAKEGGLPITSQIRCTSTTPPTETSSRTAW